MTLYDKKPRKPTMSSLEAAALIATDGATDDVQKANMMTSGQLLDEDKLVRAFYRRELGFDLSVVSDEHQYVVRDDELHLSVTCKKSINIDPAKAADEDGQLLARAVMRVKRAHDKKIKEQDNV